jgi:hypothetical protein
MTDPGGGHGWRAARHTPRRRTGTLDRLAEQAMLVEQRPLCVLLLPGPLEDLPDNVHGLAAAPGVVAVEPPRLSYRAAERLPDAIADGLAAVQARRLGLPGVARAVALFDPLQYRLARALLGIHLDAELWYGGDAAGTLHELAAERAALRFDPSGDIRPVWERMERLGVESGRLGSERPDIV